MKVADFPPRTITIIWTEGQPLEMDWTGEWDSWELEAALNEALRFVTADSQDAEEIES